MICTDVYQAPRRYSEHEEQAPQTLSVRNPDGSMKWHGFACPHCKAERTAADDKLLAERGYYTRIGLYRCGKCGGQYTLSD